MSSSMITCTVVGSLQ